MAARRTIVAPNPEFVPVGAVLDRRVVLAIPLSFFHRCTRDVDVAVRIQHKVRREIPAISRPVVARHPQFVPVRPVLHSRVVRCSRAPRFSCDVNVASPVYCQGDGEILAGIEVVPTDPAAWAAIASYPQLSSIRPILHRRVVAVRTDASGQTRDVDVPCIVHCQSNGLVEPMVPADRPVVPRRPQLAPVWPVFYCGEVRDIGPLGRSSDVDVAVRIQHKVRREIPAISRPVVARHP